MRQLTLTIACLFCAFVQAKAQKSDGVSLESFFNASTLLKGVTYLSKNEKQQDEVKVKFKIIQPYKPQWLKGEQVEIEFLNNLRYSNLKQVKMPQAYMQQEQDWLFSNQGCWFFGQQFESFAQGAVMNLKLERGVFLGKTKSYYYSQSRKSETEHQKETHQSGSLPTKKSSKASVYSTPLANLPPTDATPSEKVKVRREFLPSRYDEFLLEGQNLNKDFNAQKEKNLQVFSKQDFDQITAVSDTNEPNKIEEKEVMIIENENGIFFDQKSGYVIYYGPVELKHPEYHLKCTGDLQVKMTQQKAQKTQTNEKNAKQDDSGLEYVQAQGDAILIASIEQDGEKKKVIAKGDLIEIFVEDEVIKVKGGYPSLIQGSTKLQAGEESLSYQIDKAGSLITSKGRWKTEILDLNQFSDQ